MVGLKIALKYGTVLASAAHILKYGTYCQLGNFHSLFLFVCFDLNLKESKI